MGDRTTAETAGSSVAGFLSSLLRRLFGLRKVVGAGPPAVVLILRHAEKPAGRKKSIHLSATGYARAATLPSLFGLTAGTSPSQPRPDAIFVPTATRRSDRPAETVAPLAKALKLTVHQQFDSAQTAELARELLSGRYAGRVVLLCWRHGQIAALARALGAGEAPSAWDPTDFHSVWRIDYAEAKVQMTCLSEEWFAS